MGMLQNTKINLGCIDTFLKKKIIFAAWHMTYRCNLRCKFCSFWKNPHNVSEEFTEQDFADSIPSLLKLGVRVVNFAGGEPCIRDDVPEVMSHFSKDFIVVLNSNGLRIDEAYAERIWESGCDIVNISLDFFDRDKHNYYRGAPNAWDDAVRAMKILNARKLKKGQRVAMQAILSPENIGEFENMVRLAEDLEVDFTFNPYRFGDHEVDMSFKNADLGFLYDLQKKYRSFIATDYALEKTQEFVREGSTGTCCMGRYMLAIDPYGNVGPCENMMEHCAGNIRTDSPETIRDNLLEIHNKHMCNRCLTRERSEVEPLYEHVLSPGWIREAMLVRKS